MENKPEAKHVNDQDLWSIFWRSFLLQGAFSFERMQTHGWVYTMSPLLTKLYPKKEDLTAALKRHLVFFNTHPWLANILMGITASMEEQYSNNPDTVDVSAVNDIKGALLGPLAGLGDSVLGSTWRTVTASIAVSLALTGNPLAPLLFLVLFNIPHIYLRWWGTFKGYQYGVSALDRLQGDQMRIYTEGAGIVGLFAVGALLATWVNVGTPLQYTAGGAADHAFKIQSMLDGIFPGFLTLLFFLAALVALRRGWSTTNVMLGMLAIGIIGGFFGILS